MYADNDLEFFHLLDPEMRVEVRDPAAAYSAVQIFATSIALCSFSTLYAYAKTIGLDVNGVTMRTRWGYAEGENRIDHLELAIHWPGLPELRRQAAERAASLCTLHRTLARPLRVATHLHR